MNYPDRQAIEEIWNWVGMEALKKRKAKNGRFRDRAKVSGQQGGINPMHSVRQAYAPVAAIAILQEPQVKKPNFSACP
jgi:hypothetical protein